MVLSVVIILLIAVVAYFHYVQGLFSATISAVCAAIAAVVAVSYHENVAALFKGAAANHAQAMSLVVLFAFIYFILRMIVDRAVPGNVRYPLMVDKVGAGAVGVIAGLFATGVLALAAESLPFGPSLAGYTRYSVADRPATVQGSRGGNVDATTNDEILDNNLDDTKTALNPAKKSGLIIPVDDMIANVVGQLSSGALGNDHPLAAVHPDWPTELFGQRAGVQVGTKHVLLNLPGLQMVSLGDVSKLDSVPQIDDEFKDARDTSGDSFQASVLKNPTLKPAADETLLVVRVKFDQNATDEDSKVRVSPLSVRLVGWKDEGGAKVYTNFHPIGTLEDATALFRNKPDDPLIVNGGKSVDFVFKLPREQVLTDPGSKPKELKIKDGVFVEVKRMAQMDLSGHEVKPAPTYSSDIDQGVVRKPLDQAKNLPKHGETASQSGGGEQGASSPLQFSAIKVGNKLFSPVYPGQFNGDTNVSFDAGNATMKNKVFAKLTVNPGKSIKDIAQGDFPVTDFYVPDGKKMVQITGKPSGNDKWAWANLSAFELVGADGAKYKSNGAMVEISQMSAPMMLANYDADNEVQNIDHKDGNVNRVHLLFNVPNGTQIKELDFNGQPAYSKGVKVP